MLVVGLSLAAFSPLVQAADKSDFEKWLARPIIGPQAALAEVQQYTEDRVPLIPKVENAAQWETFATQTRNNVLKQVVFRGEAADWRDATCGVKWLETIDGGPGYRIKKLRYEALPGLWVPALLYEPTRLEGKVPVVMNVNGHDGKGKAAGYKQIRCINQAKRGMIALNVEWLGMGQLRTDGFRHYRMNQLDLCGTSGLAPFYLSMKRGLDVLLSHEHADPQRVAVAGLSGGGWQTIVISSLDTRVTLCNPVAGYSSFRTRARNFSDLGDSEQTPVDLASVADYAHLTAMLAPRAALLTYNIKDNCCFASGHALPPLLQAAEPIYKLLGREDRLRSHVNRDPGTHNFERDNRQALYGMMADHFYGGSANFPREEIPSDDEVKTADELQVALPEENADFHSLSTALMADLPRDAELPSEFAAAARWQVSRRKQLGEVVKAKQYTVTAEEAGQETKDGITATFWRLRLGDAWTVPAVEMRGERIRGTTILVADEGRKSTGAEVEKLLAAGQRVLAVDPFYFGESKIQQKDFLFGLLVSSIGDRPLGIQASQLTAIGRWLKSQEQTGGAVTIAAHGPRSSLFCLVAAALEPEAIAGVELHGSYGSLKEVIEQNRGVNEAPELFCFGLLEQFDIRQLAALVAPRPALFTSPSDRARQELADLEAWYAQFGTGFQPVP